MVSFGNASGPVPPFDIARPRGKGSLYLTRPTLVTYTATRADLVEANDLFDMVQSGQGQDRDQPALPAAGRAAGAPRPRGPQDHRLDRAHPVMQSFSSYG